MPLQIRGPGIPQGVSVSPLVDQRRPGADHPRRRERPARAWPWTAARCSRWPSIPGSSRDASSWSSEPSFEAIRTPRYMYAEHDNGERELYDLKRDPFELRSRHEDPAYASVKASSRLVSTCLGAAADPAAASIAPTSRRPDSAASGANGRPSDPVPMGGRSRSRRASSAHDAGSRTLRRHSATPYGSKL